MGRCHLPSNLSPGAPLVVALHGCTQTAGDYDNGSGWSQLADREGFAVLYPEQQRGNNPNLCFNWFMPEDASRGSGEALSIRQMIETLVAREGLDDRRVFITGLSAGGAMASVMLATYPELFAAGAIIAGLPYGCASTIPEAFDLMRGTRIPSDQALGAAVRNASRHAGPWPRVSVWQGAADQTVNPVCADAIVAQWRSLHGLSVAAPQVSRPYGHARRVWSDAVGRAVIEEYVIAGMGHGVPLATQQRPGYGEPGPYMLEAGISSTHQIARFWGLATASAGDAEAEVDLPGADARVGLHARRSAGASKGRTSEPETDAMGHANGIRKVIEDALRSAGLMR